MARITLATVRRLALAFPGVEEGLWEDGVTLVVQCGDDERDFRMKADPETFFNTDHGGWFATKQVTLSEAKGA